MSERNTVAQSLHDLGLAAWFGGGLFGAAATNASTEELRDPADRLRASNAAWNRWTPVNAAFIAAHLLGGAQLTRANRARAVEQTGFRGASLVKLLLTVAALGASLWPRLIGNRLSDYEASFSGSAGGEGVAEPSGEARPSDAGAEPAAEGVTQPAPQTPPEVADAMRQLKVAQYAGPVLTGGMIVLNAYLSQSLKPASTLRGLLRRD